MVCECCMDCYKIDICNGKCDFKCEECIHNKNNKDVCKCCFFCHKKQECEKSCENQCFKCEHKIELQNLFGIENKSTYEDELNSRKVEYRKKHKNCSYCVFIKYVSKPGISIEYEKCEVKDKIIKNHKLNALFCKCYKVE